MPSSPSTRLRVELQAAGENLNTWGAPKLNSALQRLEEAIGGRYGVALSGPVTLTSTNYNADQARMKFLDFTSGSGGTVTIPSVEKTYLVRNATSGNVIITTGSGATATIVAGDIVHVACDGTNCYSARAYDVGGNKITNLGTPTSNTDAVTKLYADGLAFSAVLPDQTGNSGKYLTTNGTAGSWASLGTAAAQNTGTSGATLPFCNGVNTWAGVQTFSVAPVFSNQSGTRSALGLGSAATQSTGTSGAALPFLNAANTWSASQAFSGAGTGLTGFNNLTSGTVGASSSPAPYLFGVSGGLNTDYIFALYRDTPFTGTGTMAFGIKRSGTLQIPQTAAGTASIDASGNLTTSSDGRLKEVVSVFTRGLADLKAMDGPVMYRWLTEVAEGVDARYVGWIAQGVAKGVPEAVHQGRNDLYSLNDRAIIAALFNTALELAARVEALEAAR